MAHTLKFPVSKICSLCAWVERKPSPIGNSAETSPLVDPHCSSDSVGTEYFGCYRLLGAQLNLTPVSLLGGSRARYVDVLNPSGTQRSEPALAPSDFFAPLAPLPIPSNLFVPNPGRQPMC